MYPLLCGRVTNRPGILIKCTLHHVRLPSSSITHSERVSNFIFHTSKRSLASYCDFYRHNRHNISNSNHPVYQMHACNSIQNGRLIHSSAFLLIDEPSSKLEETVPLKKYEERIEEIGILKTQLAILKTQLAVSELGEKKYQLLLGLRAVIEFLEGPYLWPRGVVKPNTRRRKWMLYLTSKDTVFTSSSRIMELRGRVFEEHKLSAEAFVNNLIILYGEFSDIAAHKIRLPQDVTESTIKEAVELIGVYKHADLLHTVEIIVTPFKSIESPKTELDENDQSDEEE